MSYYVDGERVGPRLAKRVWQHYAATAGWALEEAASIWDRASTDEDARETMWDAGVEVIVN